ncbi:MAG TPA: CDP-alcohol phosphatidyltransferase family protein [Rhizomicrobium sp.]|jgi:cardiolipin synthase
MIRQLPNALTALRLFSAPILAAFLLYGHQTYAFAVFAFAGFTDFADGFLAKRFGLMTPVGRYFDPAADKMLMLAAFLALTAIHQTPLWLTLLVIGRDLSIVFGIAVARWLDLPLRIQPLAIGKLCTAVQVVYVAMVLLFLAFHWNGARPVGAAVFVAAAVTIASWLAYAAVWLKALAVRYGKAV